MGAAGAALLLAQDKAVFEGRVADSLTGLGVARAAIHLAPLKDGQPGYGGRAGSDGRFRFEAIAPGDYHLEVSARGYADAVATMVESGRAITVLSFTAGQTIAGASILLDAEAVVTGRVTDAQGEALTGVTIVADQVAWQDGIRVFNQAGHAEVDDRGEYRLKLLPGRYYLTANYTALGELFTEDPGKPEMRTGPLVLDSPVELRAGQQLGGMDFKLPAVVTYHVRGTLAPFRRPPGTFLVLLRSRTHDRSGYTAAGTIEKDGSFDIPGVLPGNYSVGVLPVPRFTTVNIPIDVTDRDMNGVKVPAMPLFEVRGHARFEENDAAIPLSAVKLDLQQLDWAWVDSSPHFSPGQDGTFLLNSMRCGEYVPRIVSQGDYYLKSVTIGGRPAEGGRIDLRNGPVGEIEMVFGTGTGELTGTVRWPDPVPGSEATILQASRAILVSDGGTTGNTGARDVEIDPHGQFRFRFVPPGRWLVFASPAFDAGLWQNADFVKHISSRGAAIDLDKRAAAHAAVEPLTAEDIERAAGGANR